MVQKSSNKHWTLESTIFLLKYYPSDYTTWVDDKAPNRTQINGHIENLAAVMGRTKAAADRMIRRIANGDVEVENTLNEKNLFYSLTSSQTAFEKFVDNAEYLSCKKETRMLIDSHSDAPRATSNGRIKLSDYDMEEAKRIVGGDANGIKKLKATKKDTLTPKKTIQVAEVQGQRVYKVVKQTVTETTYYYKEDDKAFKSLV